MATSQMNKVIQHLRQTGLAGVQSGLTDGQLLERYLSRRDQAALGALVQRHGSMVWGVCRRLLRHYQDAEDAFQATFLVLVRKATVIVPREMVGNWLYGVAQQTALKARATSAKRSAREKQVAAMPETETSEPDFESDLPARLDQELSRLPDKYRAPVVLCELEGKTRKEVARQLNVPEGTVASRLARGKALLASRLSHHGGPVTTAALAAVLAQQAAAASVPAAVVADTIQTLQQVTAGAAGVAATIPARVAALSEGVLKTMLWTKLKSITTVLLVVSLAACTCAMMATGQGESQNPGEGQPRARVDNDRPVPPPIRGADSDQEKLQGKWRVVSGELFGEKLKASAFRHDATEAVFDGHVATLIAADRYAEDSVVKRQGPFTIDPAKKPKAMNVKFPLYTTSVIYEVQDNRLAICFPYPNDMIHRALRPSTLAGTGPHRMLIRFERVPQPNPSPSATAEVKPAPKPQAPADRVADVPPTNNTGSWADKLFAETSKDFGICERGTQLKHRFKITNRYAVPLDITHVRASCGCLTYTLSRTSLRPRESGYLEVILDSTRFVGSKQVVLYVTFGPNYSSTATLHVSARSQSLEKVSVVLRVGKETPYKKVARLLQALQDIPGVQVETQVLDGQAASMSALLRVNGDTASALVTRVREVLEKGGVSKALLSQMP
jgi:RNA polymerase sigma factor (sigma-70 family)